MSEDPEWGVSADKVASDESDAVCVMTMACRSGSGVGEGGTDGREAVQERTAKVDSANSKGGDRRRRYKETVRSLNLGNGMRSETRSSEAQMTLLPALRGPGRQRGRRGLRCALRVDSESGEGPTVVYSTGTSRFSNADLAGHRDRLRGRVRDRDGCAVRRPAVGRSKKRTCCKLSAR